VELPSTIVSADEVIYHRPLPDRDPLFSGNTAAERSVFERVGPFNEHPGLLPAAEDNEWGYRALCAGVAILYAPEVAVRHVDWRSPAELVTTYRRYARGQGGFYGLYLRAGRLVHRAKKLGAAELGIYYAAAKLALLPSDVVSELVG
jgi:GT2 family glycosyltransferase